MPTVFGSHDGDTEAVYGMGMEAYGTDDDNIFFERDSGTFNAQNGFDDLNARENELQRRGLATSLLDDDPFLTIPGTTRLDDVHKKKHAHKASQSTDPTEAVFDPLARTDEASGVKKKRKTAPPMPKLDTNVLTSDKGFNYLRENAPKLKFKGKGHEAEDLSKLIQFYQIWGVKLFPRLQFNAFVAQVEKMCKTRYMHIQADAWRDDHFRKERELRDGVQEEPHVPSNDDWEALFQQELDSAPFDDLPEEFEDGAATLRTNRRLFDDMDEDDDMPTQRSKSRRILDDDMDEDEFPIPTSSTKTLPVNDEDDFDFLEQAINAANQA